MRFRYLRDPLFLTCLVAYFVNRFVFKRIWTDGFVHSSFNDLICLPFWVPIMLWGQRRLGLRRTDDPPSAMEIIIPLLLWSWIFELILPATQWFGPDFYADYWDVFYYALGALGAGIFWRLWYREIKL